MDTNKLWLLLTPDQAPHVQDATGSHAVRKNPTTWYVHVKAADIADTTLAPRYEQAVVTALIRSATRVGRETSDATPPVVGGSSRQRIRPADCQVVPASGICDEHGTDCG